MDEQRMLEMIRRIGRIAAAREPVEAIFTALARFEQQAGRYNTRHLADPSPGEEEWRSIHAELEPHAGEVARVLATYRDSFSLNLTTGLDAAAGLIDEAAAYGVDAPSVLKQFDEQNAVGKVERVASKLNVFLHSWGRPSLKRFRGEQMELAIAHATYIQREASYFATYIARLLNRGAAGDGGTNDTL